MTRTLAAALLLALLPAQAWAHGRAPSIVGVHGRGADEAALIQLSNGFAVATSSDERAYLCPTLWAGPEAPATVYDGARFWMASTRHIYALDLSRREIAAGPAELQGSFAIALTEGEYGTLGLFRVGVGGALWALDGEPELLVEADEIWTAVASRADDAVLARVDDGQLVLATVVEDGVVETHRSRSIECY